MAKVQYKFSEDKLWVTIEGECSFDEMTEMIYESPKVVPECNDVFILTDFRKAKFNFTLDQVEAFSKMNDEALSRFAHRYEAIVGFSIEELSNILYFEHISAQPNHIIKVFTDVDEAKAWLDVCIIQKK